jgi:hypothetical protein
MTDEGDDSADSSEESVSSSSSDGTYTPETSSGDDSEGAFTDHSEEFDYDEETKTYSVKDWPDGVWQQHYEKIPHDPLETCYEMDDGKSLHWNITEMPGMDLSPDPVVLAHMEACDKNEIFTYGDEQYTSPEIIKGLIPSYERADRRLKTTFSIASRHFHGIPPGKRTVNNPRIYVNAMQFGNINCVTQLDATVTMSPGMLAYVKDKGWCIIQNITAYNNGPQR